MLQHWKLVAMHITAWLFKRLGARMYLEGASEVRFEETYATLRWNGMLIAQVKLYAHDARPRTPTLPADYTGA